MITISDGSIKISIEVNGKQVEYAAKELDRLEDSGHRSGRGAKQAEEGMKGVDRESKKATGSVKGFAASLGLVAIGATAFKILRASMDDAIKRFDTMNNFPKVLQGLGVSAEDSKRSIQSLSDGIDGLPTKLDDIASTAQQMYTSFNDMDKATDSALALNNALLSQSADAGQARRGTEQYLKVLQTGKVDMQTWTTLSETMDIGLVKIADSFGYVGRSAKSDLYKALQDGTVTIDQFNNKLIELGTGTGELATLARENSLGLATSWANLGTAFARGVTLMIESFNDLSMAVTGREISENIDRLKVVVYGAFQAIAKVIEATTPVIAMFAAGVSVLSPLFEFLTPLIIGFTVALTASIGAMAATTLALKAKAAAVTALSGALTLLSGPVGWVSLGIGAVAAGAVAVVKWFKRASPEAKKLKKEVEDLSESTDELVDSFKSSADAYKDNQSDIKSSATAHEDLAKTIDELSRKEGKSATDKQMLSSYIDKLNESVDGLNLSYDEEADALSMSSEEIKARVDLMEQQASYNSALERQVEISKEQNEVDMKLDEINGLREKSNQLHEDGEISKREHKKEVAALDEKEQELMGTKADLADQQEETENVMIASIDAITEAVESGVAGQLISFERLSDANKELVEDMKATWEDYKDAATDMFDTLSDEATLTAEEMKENLEENQRVIGEWAEGIATLAERGVHDGLLDTLREAGPESAGHVNALVNASDDELRKLSNVFAKGGDVATDALTKSLGIEESGVMQAVGHLVTDTKKSLSDRIKDAKFKELGIEIAKGQAEGMIEGTPEAEKAAVDMAKSVSDVTAKELGIQSPSKVFKGYGGDVTDGMKLGISDGTAKVLSAASKLLRSTVSEFNGIRSDFNRIGQNAMAGLNAGLNAGRNNVMNTARSIANQVTATMQNALKIKSPSQIMRDKVGRWIPEGVAEGIEDNTNSVLIAANNMANRMIKFERPEIALGASMAQSAQLGNTTFNNYTNNYESPAKTRQSSGLNKKVYVQSVVNLDGREIAEGTWEEISRLLGRDAQVKARFKGVNSIPLR